jgi:hypothetical protein
MKINWEDHFTYDENSPSGLISKKTGKPHGSLNIRDGKVISWVAWINRTTYVASRIIYEMMIGPIPAEWVIDHIDRDPSNNKISNMRAVPRVLNCRNNSKRVKNISGTTGVYFDGTSGMGRWCARWNEQVGKARKKNFAVSKYGFDKAKELAVRYREDKLRDLIESGYGYTDNHGE